MKQFLQNADTQDCCVTINNLDTINKTTSLHPTQKQLLQVNAVKNESSKSIVFTAQMTALGVLAELTEQTAACIGSIRNTTFHSKIRDDSVFYRTGGNPRLRLVS